MKVLETLRAHLLKRRYYWMAVGVPILLVSIYYFGIATERYVSNARLVVESDATSAVPTGDLLGFLTGSQGEATRDAELVKSFILSPAMVEFLDAELQLKAHYSHPDIDWFSRLDPDSSREAFFNYYLSHVKVEIAIGAPIVELSIQGFDREYARKLTETIAGRAERFVNEVGQGLAREQVTFVRGEMEKANARLQSEARNLIELQNQRRMLDPQVESQSVGAIIAGLQQSLSQERTGLKALQSYLSESAAEVIAARKKIAAIEQQLQQERSRQVKAGKLDPLNDLILEFKEREMALQIATDVYQGGLKSLEAAKLEASRKVKHLVQLSAPTLPDASLEPRRFYLVGTVFLFLNLLYLVGGLLIASILDHQE